MSSALNPQNGIVTSPHAQASQVGCKILEAGGTAVEAAVAIAATLAVVYPHMTGLGGDSFWLIRSPEGKLFGIDACGAAAQNISLETYQRAGLKTIPFRGPLAAITVAGTVSGWQKVLAETETHLPLSDLLEPAIALAENGVVITKSGANVAALKDAELRANPTYSEIFRPHNRPLKEHDRLHQPALAQTLKRLVKQGLEDFYTGDLAADIISDLSAVGSPITAEDLSTHSALKTHPLEQDIFSAKVYNLPPPTQGLSSLLILALFEKLNVQQGETYAHIHGLVEATKQAFKLARSIELGDPALMQRSAESVLADDALKAQLAAEIAMQGAQPWPDPTQAGDTTWFGAMDRQGWVVSAIQSTYFEFGSGVVLPKTGLTWQNRGASFRLAASGWNALQPGRKPFHTLNPALAVFPDGRTLAYGTMGGEGQPQTQAAIFTRYARFGMDLQTAVSAPRWLLGRTWGEQSTSLKLESRFDPTLIAALQAAGHKVETVSDYSEIMGHAGALVSHLGSGFEGTSDPRSDGEAIGW